MFLQSWDGLLAYTFPPRSVIPQVLAKLHTSQGTYLTGGSGLASAPVVSRAPGSGGCSSGSAAVPPGSSVLTSVGSPLSGSPQASASASCLETLQRFTRADGFSSGVASQDDLAHRSSSRTNYQLKWSTYRSWCRAKGHSISRPSFSKVADFLLWLRRHKGLSVSSVMGYRSMLSAVFHFQLPGLSSHPVLRDLLRSFRLEAPSRPFHPPAWDLAAVLTFLNSAVFEPLWLAALRNLTKKVLFLLALATAKRVGELQALSRSVSFVRADDCLSYVLEFVAKTESLSNPIPRSFLARSLSDFAAGLDEELLLCPVRALRIYLDRTASFSPLPRRLFVSPRRPSRDLSKNFVSFLREVIHEAEAGRPEVGLVRAHSVRWVSTSAAFHRNWSVASMLESATWRSSSVFVLFYLRDLQHDFEGLCSLGPFVAAGSRIT